MEINASHFKTMEELIKHINMCVREEDIFALERYVGLNELDILVKEIARLNKIIDEFEKNLKRYDLQYLHETGEHQLAYAIENMLDKLKELKKEGKE